METETLNLNRQDPIWFGATTWTAWGEPICEHCAETAPEPEVIDTVATLTLADGAHYCYVCERYMFTMINTSRRTA